MTTSITPLPAQAKFQLPNYTFVEKIYQSACTTVYRAMEIGTQNLVVIKVLTQEYPSFSELIQFRNQYTVAKNLPISGIVQPLCLESYGNGYGLVMEDIGGIDLDRYGEQHPLSFTDVLDIAIQLADILHDLHQYRVIHKDLKPANILIQPDSKQIHLIDFSLSSLLPKETQVIQSPKSLEGTLAYLAPEQTGRMNRAIDYRTDFYSLGVTLYQLFTGQLPFTSNDLMELIHSHMAQMPVAADQVKPELPSIVAAIIAKLMAKNAENRYQSALGLKYDLGQCLQQWKEQGEILEFQLGQQDLSDRFVIPEKLYGRESEVQSLLDAFDRISQGDSELMLVAGFSGIGKTAVVNEVHKPIVRQRGYFIKGKFDQFNRNIPFSAFVQAFRDLMEQLLSESDEDLARWESKILGVVGDNGQVLIEVIPELERVIGPQPAAPELSGIAAQNRFNLLFQSFIAIFTTPDHPLVMFLDDLQWADSASLNLMKVLMGESDSQYLLLLGAYRDNEVFPAHPLMLTLDELEKQSAAISTMTLEPLSTTYIHQLVAETLSHDANAAKPLTELVYQKTQGNPFFTTQFLKGLYEDALIEFNSEKGGWDCDLMRIEDAVLADDVVTFMASRLRRLPEGTQEVLKLAACIGNQFDLETLAIVCVSDVETVATDLWAALREGLLIPITEAYKFFQERKKDEHYGKDVVVGYRFLHDRVQQAAYSLIPDSDRKNTHRQIGQLLLSQSDSQTLDEMLFAIVGQLNMGLELIDTQDEKLKLAQLNLMAGKKAKASTAYGAAIEYLQTAQTLLPEQQWQSHYALSLDIAVEHVEAEYLNTNFDAIEDLSAGILEQTQTLLDAIKVYEIKIRTWIGQGDQRQALETGLDVLKLLGVSLRKTPPEPVADIAGLVDAPAMSDPNYLAAMKIMEFIVTPAWAVSPDDFQHITFTMVDLSIQHGNCAASAFGYTWYGTLLCEVLGDIDQGYEFGQLAIALLDRFPAGELQAKVLILNATCVGFWKKHVRDFLPSHLHGLKSGLENGEIEYACYGAAEYAQYIFLIGFPLEEVRDESYKQLEIIQHFKQDFHVEYMVPCLQGALNLLGEGGSQRKLDGPVYREDERLPTLVEEKQLTLLFIIYFVKSLVSYVLGDSPTAVEEGAIARENCAGVAGTLFVPLELFYSSLARIDCLNQWDSERAEAERSDVLECLSKLKHWAKYAPMNYQHKCDLMEAELARHDQRTVDAIELYDRAIAGAKENQYLQDEGIANERAAQFYLEWGKEKVAAAYMQEAYYCYVHWGAKVKIDQLVAEYPHLLAPILQKTKSDNSLRLSSSQHGISTSIETATSSTAVDLISVVKASQTLSGTVNLDTLLSQLMGILLENAGADSGSLILKHVDDDGDGDQIEQWTVVAQSIGDRCELVRLPLDTAQGLPINIIHQVRRNQAPVMINNVEKELDLEATHYLKQRIPQSLFCSPILNQGRLIGILYLENYLATDAFTTDRVELLNLITTQAAISIENADLYGTLEQKVEQRTAELSQALDHLKATQKRLVESEKMAALGGLVAGVAHEINTPIGTSITLASTLADETQVFAEQIKQGQLKRSILNGFLTMATDSSQLMLLNLQRAGDLIQSFKQIAVDQNNLEQRQFNLKAYVEEITLSLAPKLKLTPHTLKVVGEDTLMIESWPGAIAQLVTNLVMNSIHHAYPQEQAGQLTWDIQSSDDQVTLAYQDDGCGIPPDHLQKIFDPFFTTARHSGGTGLGLHIVYNLVTQKLKGTIEVTSQVNQGTHFAITLPYGVEQTNSP